MYWFRRKRIEVKRAERLETLNLQIQIAKDINERASEQALDDANQLKDLLEHNHFSATLYIAVGGKLPSRTSKEKHA